MQAAVALLEINLPTAVVGFKIDLALGRIAQLEEVEELKSLPASVRVACEIILVTKNERKRKKNEAQHDSK